ncbi:hypothetical protein NLJ89_g11235 [Agrocybe chaxingu]|uniref:Uncharacterized protein n=1 Tax=Agrocybe chaxingu TaxID=84603 RepID=A0A9W8JWN5_9AGAR|nr:hypothetical protein NLJ89_g11235 [Agrocybe chaxingu]
MASNFFNDNLRSKEALTQLSAFILVRRSHAKMEEAHTHYVVALPFLLYGICTMLSGWVEDEQMVKVEHHSPILNTMLAWFEWIHQPNNISPEEFAFSLAILLAVAWAGVINRHCHSSPYVLVQALRTLAVAIGHSPPLFSDPDHLRPTAQALIGILRLGLPSSNATSELAPADLHLMKEEAFLCIDILFPPLNL